MNVPKYIELALQRRANAANSFFKNDRIVSDFIEKNEITADPTDYGGGAASLFEPKESNERLIEDIRNH